MAKKFMKRKELKLGKIWGIMNKKLILAFVFILFISAVFIVNVFAFAGGDGSAGNPFQISTCAELQDMKNGLSANYILINDVDCSVTVNWNGGAGFEPVGTQPTPFTGNFDGRNHTITGLFINRGGENYVGLFGHTGSSADILNVGLEDVDITGKLFVGGLVSLNEAGGTITNSYSTGSVSGSTIVGGLISDNLGTITNSYSTGSVSGSSYVGGLVGVHAGGTITNSYSTGSVSGSSFVGGLVGLNDFGTITNSYWDTQTSGQSTSAGGVGKTTAQMMQQTTFVGWDFVDVWGIDENVSYPFLLWQTLPVVSAISSCGTLGSPNTVNTLTTDVSSSDTCFMITADNVTLDCQGHKITYATSVTGNAVTLTGFDNATIKNCNIVQGNSSNSQSFGIRVQSTSNSLIENNTIATNGPASHAIHVRSTSLTNFTNNNITTSGFSAMGISLEAFNSNNNVVDNTVTTSGPSSSGVRLLDWSSDNKIVNNIITTTATTGFSSHGIHLRTRSSRNTLANNTITTGTSRESRGIILGPGVNSFNTVANNTISTSSTSGRGIEIRDQENSVTNNTITTTGIAAHGIRIWASSSNTVASNTISANGAGIQLQSTSSNTITSNRINRALSTDFSGGFYILFGSSNNLIFNNLINASRELATFSYTGTNNRWNTTKDCTKTNIIGGPCLGGNFWTNPSGTGFSDSCADSSPSDGICDSSLTLVASTDIDFLPLAPAALDADSDGIPDDVDNCPLDSNPDQSDIDGQNGGDVCDICPSDATDTCDVNMTASESINASGGTVETTDGSVSMTIPPGALDNDTSISVTEDGTKYELTSNLGTALGVFGLDIQPEGTVFNVPITIVFAWEDADNDGVVDNTNILEENLIITKNNVVITDRCRFEPGCNTTANTFTFNVTSLSIFALIGPLDSDNDGVPDDFDGVVDLCPLEDARGFDANSDGCIDTVEALITETQSLNLKQGISNSLDAKLQNAKDALEAANAGKRQDAINKLESFINAVEAQRNKEITNEQADLLIDMTNNIITIITQLS